MWKLWITIEKVAFPEFPVWSIEFVQILFLKFLPELKKYYVHVVFVVVFFAAVYLLDICSRFWQICFLILLMVDLFLTNTYYHYIIIYYIISHIIILSKASAVWSLFWRHPFTAEDSAGEQMM